MSITDKNTSPKDQTTINGSSSVNGRRQTLLNRLAASGNDDLGFAGSTSGEGTTMASQSTAHRANGHPSTATGDEDLDEAYLNRPNRQGGLIDQWLRYAGGR
ncbi:hypothetical protein I302_100722 [Kwoniella bestiolae CBS 10118]|uniref:Uncharacterized protein n=1 Tax=Kwoniella bestiolae CBS 10118 TaxID=1296100 RepID=A0A1B9G5Y2_9TREE|nr:hypothetical protein I302_04097 [Kwoniella bestiolae CBS 10118]OCF26412.1 hypothetical protein I302_04097 [Kwoniella bestiolae CBS 10118]